MSEILTPEQFRMKYVATNVNAAQLKGTNTKSQLCGDANRQKELFLCTRIRPDLTTDVTYEVYDHKAEDMKLVTVTWELELAIASYNSL